MHHPRRCVFTLSPLLAFPLLGATMTEFVPSAASRGARALITGTGLSDPAISVVFTGTSGDVAATIVARQETLLDLEIPSTASSGPVRVLHGTSTVGTFSFTLVEEPRLLNVATIARTLATPGGIAVTRTGIVYAVETQAHRVVRVHATGEVQVVAGTGKPGNVDGPALTAQFSFPTGIAVDDERNILYVSDTRNHCIRAIHADGRVTTLAGSGRPADTDGSGAFAAFREPRGLALGDRGLLYVADTQNHKVKTVTPEGVVTSLAGTGRPSFRDGALRDAGFHDPSAIAITSSVIYVIDTRNSALRKIENGGVATVAGTGQPGYVDGDGALAQFQHPAGVATSDGLVYIADTGNHRIRTFDPATRSVATLTGTGAPGHVDGALAAAAFKQPTSLIFRGALFVADTGNDALRTLNPELRFTDLYPRRGPLAGGPVSLFGAGFVPGRTTVTLDGTAIPSAFVSGTRLDAVLPAHAAGAVTIGIVTPAGTAALEKEYAYLPPPTITSIAPAKGRASGGASNVTVTGTGFVQNETAVLLGSAALTNPNVTDATPVTATTSIGSMLLGTTPAGSHGAVDVTVRTAGGTATLPGGFRYFEAPVVTSFTPASGGPGTQVTIRGDRFDAEAAGNHVRFGTVLATVVSASATEIVTSVPAGATNAPLFVTTAGGTAQSPSDFVVAAVVALAISPSTLQLRVGDELQLTATGQTSPGAQIDLTTTSAWASSNGGAVSVTTTGRVRGLAAGSATINASYGGLSASALVQVTPDEALPPDPTLTAPPVTQSVPTTLASSAQFLYTGPNAVQTGVAPNAIDTVRIAVLRGRITTATGAPLAGVRVTIPGQPALGQTLTRTTGQYDLALNGGGPITVRFEKQGYLPVDRTVQTRWQDYTVLPDVTMLTLDPNVTTMQSGAAQLQIAHGSVTSDANGARRATLLLPAGSTISMKMPDGTSRALASAAIRATEYTVGPKGPSSMPAELPPQSAYTYCVELSADEAITVGATSVTFSKPAIFYLENFLGFPVGGIVPAGYYDKEKRAWIASDNGMILKITATTGGIADIDLTGDNVAESAATLATFGIDDAERRQLGATYSAGQSLWRVPIPHLTPWDCNWPYGPPADAVAPKMKAPRPRRNLDDPTCSSGSIIECENQTLGETILVVGAPFSLHYRSDRVPGRKDHDFDIGLLDSTVPASLRRVTLDVDVAGRRFASEFAPRPNLEYTFEWDGKDAYGRTVQGSQEVSVHIGYVYGAVYQEPAEFGNAFGRLSGVPMAGNRQRAEISLLQDFIITTGIGIWDARGAGLGGWTASIHHAYDGVRRAIYQGDGTTRTTAGLGSMVTTAAGNGQCCTFESGKHATETAIDFPFGTTLAVAPDGTLYIGDAGLAAIRRVSPGGIATTIAGTGDNVDAGDGGPAILASVREVNIAAGSDGSLYVIGWHRIRRIAPDGIINTIAGDGTAGFSGDNGPARFARVSSPEALAVGPDGSVYFSDLGNRRIRRIDPAGIITTAAGNGAFGEQDNLPATKAAIGQPVGLAVGPDGSIYFTAGATVKRIGPDGIIRRFAGTGQRSYTGDGGPALAATFGYIWGLSCGPDGSVYIVDQGFSRVRQVTPDGIINTIGAGPQRGYGGDGGPALAARMNSPTHAVPAPDGSVYVADASNRRIRRLSPSLPRFNRGDTIVPSSDARAVYIFDSAGRHLRTVDALTGTAVWTFAYDSEGRLVSATDAPGLTTRFERNMGGELTAVVAPSGERTTVAVDADGYLSAISYGDGSTARFEYAAGGLLSRLTTPRGHATTFAYHADGQLWRDTNASGGSKTLTRTGTPENTTVSMTTTMGRSRRYTVSENATGVRQRTTTDPSGLTTTEVRSPDQSTKTTLPDGTAVEAMVSGDPRFGMTAPHASVVMIKTPMGLTTTMTRTLQADLATPGDPFSLRSIISRSGINGRLYQSAYETATRQATMTTPVGRTSRVIFDSLMRPAISEIPGLAPVTVAYDARGNIKTVTRESQSTTFDYDASDRLTTITDGLGRASRFAYDSVGRITLQTLPDGRATSFEYDANGNLLSLTPPGRPAHSFTYTVIDQGETYTAPAVANSTATRYRFNADRDLTQILRAGGGTIGLSYDPGGRLASIVHPHGTLGYAYLAGGQLGSITGAAANLSYRYDGLLPLGATWSGAVSGAIDWAYDTDFRVFEEKVNGIGIPFGYDDDSLLVSAGSLTLARDPQNGLLTGTTLGVTTDAWTYTSLGEPATYTASVTGVPVFAQQDTRDSAGRVTAITETRYGLTFTKGYQYDTAGRLTEVSRGGAVETTYAYDGNSNRLTKTTGGTTTTATYDAQDRLLTYGNAIYDYTPDGELKSKTDPAGTTTYDYDALGNLRKVVLPDGRIVEYVIDAQNRRVGKKINGILAKGWLYSNQLRIAAELDGGGTIISRFVYASRSNVPDFMIRGGVSFRILSDHLGSPRYVLDAATGAVVQFLDYDEFGRVLADTNPGLQPFGFAGGLLDYDTGLVRFGARDYDPHTGRWTTKDPILFEGGDTNLYGYAFSDPINFLDPNGLAGCKVPKGPAGANVVRNSLEAEDKGPDDASWWFNQVRNKGPWDYKQQGSSYEEFGNFNYGATGAALGLPEQVILRGAGWANQKADPKGRKGLPGRWWSKEPYGDDPQDQKWIKEGINFYKECMCGGE
ncbi:MAG: IPT/TIG domain-containing protein [Thermoanaerobaculia bacterium]